MNPAGELKHATDSSDIAVASPMCRLPCPSASSSIIELVHVRMSDRQPGRSEKDKSEKFAWGFR